MPIAQDQRTASWVRLPPRYLVWGPSFFERASKSLTNGSCVLDLGSGRRPTFPLDRRPPRCHYVGIDISKSEMEAAPAGSYNESWVCDISQHLPELACSFDLAVSRQLLEHVKPLRTVLENVRSYLRPGGRFVASLSGTFSAFGLINQAIPTHFGVAAMRRLLGRNPQTVFPAYYDHCWHHALTRMLASWSEVEIVPFFIGAQYFAFSKVLQRTYLNFEEWALKRAYVNLATHYLIDAIK
jgi:SAM-dependent methyltransferase